MNARKILWIALLLCGAGSALFAQSPAALAKLHQKYDPQQLEEMRQMTHYKYQGMLLYYSASFRIVENGQSRVPTEQEIAAVDLDAYNHLRQEKFNVQVHDLTLGKDIDLLSRDAFEELVLSQLDVTDTKAYLSYRSRSQSIAQETIAE